jgi:phage gp36-like protein
MYATQADLIDRFGEAEIAQLSDRVTGSTPDADVIGRALADAQAEIDAYLGVRYALPLDTVPPVIVRLAADVARYHLYSGNGNESVRQRYLDAVGLLKRLASGEVRLDGAAQHPPATGAITVGVRAPRRVFGADTLQSY